VSSRIIVAVRVAASPARAFEVFTGEIGSWWSPNPLFRFTPRDPGVLAFEPGEGGRLVQTLPSGKVFEIGKVRVWAPPSRLVFGWRQATFEPDQMTEVEVRFEPVGEETRVTVEHTGWDSVPAAHAARHRFPDAVFLRRHAEWWQALMGEYKARGAEDEGRAT
jgi:uncharacterized protein YndB with AHSA1/START domain